MNKKPFTDIPSLSRLMAWLPEPLLPYARLMRLDRPIGTWLLVLPCWWGLAFSSSTFIPNLWLVFLFGVGSIIMRGAGCVINDIYDRKLDCLVERTQMRPLANGDITLTRAILFLFVLLCLGLVVLLQMNRATLIIGVASLLLIFTYPLMKRITWWPQLFLGFTFNWGILMGSTATTGSLNLAVLLAYMAAIFWTLGYDTIYAHQDKNDDATIGIKSTALLFGDKSVLWVASFYALALILLSLAGFADGLHHSYQWGLLMAACYAARELFLWQPSDPEDCLIRFKSNRDFGLIVLASIMLGKIL